MSLSAEVWSFLGTGVVTVGSVTVAIIANLSQSRRTRAEAAQARQAAIEAADLARPTGNGYAEESRQTWRRIEGHQQANTEAIGRLVEANAQIRRTLEDHLEDHRAGCASRGRRWRRS